MSSEAFDPTKLTWKERRLRNAVDPDYLKSRCRGSAGLMTALVSAAVPACLLFSSAWPMAAAATAGISSEYMSYRKCIYDIDKQFGIVPGYPSGVPPPLVPNDS